MHHPDICNIILTIEDYFILTDDNQPIYTIEPIKFNREERKPTLGIRIIRKLYNGYLKAEINELGKDDNTVIFTYSKDLNNDDYIDRVKIEFRDYSTEEIRTTVRNMLIMDKNQKISN